MSQILIQGLLISGLYALIAVGFTMIFSVGRVLDLSYGIYIMFGGYAYYTAVQLWALPKVVGVVFAIVVGVLFAVLKYQLLVKRLKGDHVAVEISTLILAVVMQAGLILIFDAAAKTMWPLVDGVWHFGSVSVTFNIVTATVISWIVLAGLLIFIQSTHIGRAIRAVSMDRKGAVISGIDPDRINLLTWAISGGLGALAGVFFATYTQLSPAMWVAPLIIAVAVVIVGGIGSIIGSLIVAHLIGFMETISSSLIAPELNGVFTMLLIIGVLVITPKGLFGRADL
ncbi:MAG: branched-chain amino acid ABC transporter permease [Hyphomicrobiaceae bacterium]